MGHKQRKGATALAARGSPREELARLIQRERFREAVKFAKRVYGDAPTPENHQLVERALFYRAAQ